MRTIPFAIFLALILGGCLNRPPPEAGQGDGAGTPASATARIAQNEAEDIAPMPSATFLGALDSGGSFFCNLTDGQRRCEIWLKGGNYHARITTNKGSATEVIGDGEWTYIWYREKKTPVKYKTTEIMKMTGEVAPEDLRSGHAATVEYDVADIARHATGGGCQGALVPDSLLEPPNLRFQTVRAEIKELGAE
jgi:hypothetical protein